ncbi:hypothetical protein Dip510_000768 [Elusimicrobium posterum]|uniref:hypothetical protein n=1 Tax=Elusimicrobium posterum TaxID=3116653 RepID=UPI003C7694B3
MHFLKETLKSKKGLSKTEIVFGVLLIVLLFGLSVPKFMDILGKCREGRTIHNLNRLRSAIAAYYGENRGEYPTDNLQSLTPRYIEKIPFVFNQETGPSDKVITGKPDYTGGWVYVNDPNDFNWGDIKINLKGQDSTGKRWEDL